MRRMQWTACLWPGLPQLWMHGSWAGLALAIGAAVVLDLLLVVSFGWSELVGGNTRNIVWAAFGVCWVAAAGWSVRECRRRIAAGTPDPKHDQFAEALDTYLKGDYYRTERILEGLLRRNLRDVDARLMLATLLRHTGRFEEAGKQLDTLTRFESAGKWELELERERQLLAETQRRN